MAPITRNTLTNRVSHEILPSSHTYGVAAGAHLVAGQIVGINANGMICKPEDSYGNFLVAGRLDHEVNNVNGADGDVLGTVSEGVFAYDMSESNPLSLAAARLGQIVFLEDNGTVAADVGGMIAGIATDIVDGKCHVYIGKIASGIARGVEYALSAAGGANYVTSYNFADFSSPYTNLTQAYLIPKSDYATIGYDVRIETPFSGPGISTVTLSLDFRDGPNILTCSIDDASGGMPLSVTRGPGYNALFADGTVINATVTADAALSNLSAGHVQIQVFAQQFSGSLNPPPVL